MRIAFIGFGEAARAFCDSLAAADTKLTFSAYDILLGSEGLDGACAAAMRDRSVNVSATLAAAVTDAAWVISAVTADQSHVAAETAAACLAQGQTFFDINSVSPQRKRANAEMVASAGAVYLDMAVMAPVHPRGHRTPVLLAGPLDQATRDRLAALGFAIEVAGEEVGAATAIKMVRSLFVKGLEAITVETLLAASASGCLDYIQASLAGSYPGLGLPGFADYQIERTLKHGRRRAAEMRESAATLEELGLYGGLAAAVAEVQERMGAIGRETGPATASPDDLARLATLRQTAGR